MHGAEFPQLDRPDAPHVTGVAHEREPTVEEKPIERGIGADHPFGERIFERIFRRASDTKVGDDEYRADQRGI